MKSLFLIFMCLFVGCSSVPTSTPLPPVVVEAKVSYKAAWDAKSEAKAWSKITAEAVKTIGKDMLKVNPTDANLYCEGFKDLNEVQRTQFYVYLISLMAERESGFNPKSKYVEPDIYDANGKNVVSTGLLQISIESGNSYKCGFKSTEEIQDPAKNLPCAVTILNRWIVRDGYIGSSGVSGIKHAGGARYWSVLRNASGSQPKIKAKSLAFCQKEFH